MFPKKQPVYHDRRAWLQSEAWPLEWNAEPSSLELQAPSRESKLEVV